MRPIAATNTLARIRTERAFIFRELDDFGGKHCTFILYVLSQLASCKGESLEAVVKQDKSPEWAYLDGKRSTSLLSPKQMARQRIHIRPKKEKNLKEKSRPGACKHCLV